MGSAGIEAWEESTVKAAMLTSLADRSVVCVDGRRDRKGSTFDADLLCDLLTLVKDELVSVTLSHLNIDMEQLAQISRILMQAPNLTKLGYATTFVWRRPPPTAWQTLDGEPRLVGWMFTMQTDWFS